MLGTIIATVVAGMAASTPVIQSPVWTRAPSFEDVAAAYPARANGVDGSVSLFCRFGINGLLTQCQVTREAPAGLGFGAAAKSLAGKFAVSIDPSWGMSNERFGVEVPIRLISPDKPAIRDHLVGQPTWTTTLAPAAVSAFFPGEAAAKGLETGRGIAECTVDAKGALENCRPESAEPEGVGFSEAAVKAATGMRMNLWTRDGGPVDGATIRVPIRLTIEEPATASGSSPVVWLQTPTGEEVLKVFPRQALARNVAGQVDLRCRVRETGALAECVVSDESPAGWGFGTAAASLAREYRVSMRGHDHPEPGAWITLSVPMAAMTH